MYEGCIVDGYNPVWILAKDIASRSSAWSELNPMPIVDDKIIVGTHKNGCPGFRCLEIETGKVIWEWYANADIEHSEFGPFLSCTKGQDYIITSDNKYLIFGWNPTIMQRFEMLHIAIDLTTGKEVWRKKIPSQGSVHIGYDANDDYYYCSALNIYTPENSKYYCENVYKVRIADGEVVEEVFRPTSEVELVAHCRALPFTYRERKYLLVSEKIYFDIEDEDNHTYKYGILDRETKDTLAWHDDADNYIPDQLAGIHVHNDIVYVMCGLGGYSILDMEKMQFSESYILGKKSHELDNGKKVQQRYDWLECSYIFNNKLVIGMKFNETGREEFSEHQLEPSWIYQPHGYLIDLATNKVIRKIHADKHANIMDDILYYAEGHNFYAFDINTGEKKIDQFFSDYDCSGTSSVYKNAKGEKFVIVSNVDYTYCFPGL